MISLQLENILSKDQILEYYLNNILFGGKIYGVKEASKYYFSKELDEINYIEAAYLAGVVQRPNTYNAYYNEQAGNSRKNTVLLTMYNNDFITYQQYLDGVEVQIKDLLNSSNYQENLGEYNDFIDYILSSINLNDYNSNTLIKTTMDRDIQLSISEIMSNKTNLFPDDLLQCAIVVIENNTGNILGIGGSRASGLRNLNYATDTLMQPASTIKPILDYGPAIEYLNYMPQSIISDEEYYYASGQQVNNWDHLYKGDISFRKSLVESRNVPSIKLLNEVGYDKAFEFANNIGISTTEFYHESMAIGGFTNGFSVLDITSAYSAFANMGVYYPDTAILSISDQLNEYSYQTEPIIAMKPSTAYIINDILHGVLSNSSYNLKNKYFSAKTGQSNFDEQTRELYNLPITAIKDGWVIGYTKDLTIGCWIGYDRVSSSNYITTQINQIPRIIVTDLLNTYSNADNQGYPLPDNLTRIGVSIYNGKIYQLGNYGNTTYDYFFKGFQPLIVQSDTMI